MSVLKYSSIIFVAFCISACQENKATKQAVADSPYAKGTFGYDLDFLKKKDSVIVLNSKDGKGEIIISPKYQAKVFTSTADGASGKSFGWINYKTFEQEKLDEHMNAYGGEDRLWLGPEGGKFSLFFKPGAKMEFANWKTPAAFDPEAGDVTTHSERSVGLRKDMQLVNYAGTRLSLSVDRQIALLDRTAIDSAL